jgi:predicted AAA+ superfamily ATPase
MLGMGTRIIQRKDYLAKLAQWRDKQLIKVVTGVRRCGKSTLFDLYIQYLKDEGVEDEQIVYVNLEDIEYEDLLDYKNLYDYVKKRLTKNRYTYVFIDEVQQCENFEKAIDSLFIQKNVDVYITGSNAFMLSGELATLLSGRYVEIGVLPLSFSEYIDFWDSKPNDVKVLFNDYLKYGSFPYVATLRKEDATVKTYIEGIYNTILIKDVAKRERITDVSILENVTKFLCSAIGSPVSTKKISDTINSSGRSISVNTVEKYLRALTDSYIFYRVDRYDIKGRQHLKTLGKYYLVDIGIRNILLSGATADLGHVLENIVYLELIRRGYKVSVGKVVEKEVDFVASNADGIKYYQVAASVLDEKTLKRELEALEKISDNYPKYLLTLDEYMPSANYNGILKLNIVEWLTTKESA